MDVAGLLVAPGASGSADHPVFVALEAALGEHGVAVCRYDFEMRRAGRKGTPRAEKAAVEIADAARAFADDLGVGIERLVLGGRSFGGRVASMAVADGLPAAGLALLSYPLHPPGKPDRLRVEHFDALDLPVLFVSGDRDPFGRPEEFDAHVGAIAGPVTTTWIEGGTHDPRHKGREQAVVDAVVNWVTSAG